MSQATPAEPLRVAVLGGTGWLGRHVCSAFDRQGHQVLAVARNHASCIARYRFHPLDLAAATAEETAEVLRANRADVVVNATDAVNATDGWQRTEDDLVRANIWLVERLLAACGGLPWRVRLVHVGTIHEYGPVARGALIDESVPPRPGTCYARTRLAGSEAVLRAARAGTVEGVVLRLVNLCGPHPSPESFPGKLVRLLRETCLSPEPVPLSVADAERDFVDVRDAAEAVRTAAAAPAVGRTINIGRGVAVRPRELLRLLLAAAGLPPDAVRPRDSEVHSLGGDWTRADIRLARELLEWEPRISLQESLSDMWEAEER